MVLDLTAFVHPVDEQADKSVVAPTTPLPTVPQHEERLEYILTGILLHRGTSASAGHYFSIMKDEQTGNWWKYDDNCVTGMGAHPFKGAKWDAGSGDDPEKAVAGRKPVGGSRKGSNSKSVAKKATADAGNAGDGKGGSSRSRSVQSKPAVAARKAPGRAVPLTASERKRNRPVPGLADVAVAEDATACIKAAKTIAIVDVAGDSFAKHSVPCQSGSLGAIDVSESPVAASAVQHVARVGVHVPSGCLSCALCAPCFILPMRKIEFGLLCRVPKSLCICALSRYTSGLSHPIL
jgi:hypothetical protein